MTRRAILPYMKTTFSKRQTQSIVVLSAVLFILLCGVAYTVSGRRQSAATSTSGNDVVKPSHELVREARVSGNPYVDWETNFGGSGDEAPVAVISKNNTVYIFGNTNSHDLDFAGVQEGKTRGFCAQLSLAGRTLAYTVFDFCVAKAIPTQSGFAVAGNEGSVSGLYLLGNDLTVTAKVSAPATHALTAVGLYVFDNTYFLVSSYTDENTQKASLLLCAYSMALENIATQVFVYSYGLQLLEILPYENGYLLAANAQYQSLGCLVTARFSPGGTPAYSSVDLGYAYTPVSFLPFGVGYAALCDTGGKCELLLLNDKCERHGNMYICNTPNTNKKTLLYAGGAFYAYTGEAVVRLKDNGEVADSVPFAPLSIADFGQNDVAAFMVGMFENRIDVLCLSEKKTAAVSLRVSASAAVVAVNPTHLLLCADAKQKGGDCGGNFGQSDVWVSKVNLSAIL